jgi:uncharacterized membrane protein
MRVAFREWPWDLVATVGLAFVALTVIAATGQGPVRFALGLALVLFLPGYAIAAAVFPKEGEVDWIERIALSFGLSIAIVSLLGLLLSGTPWGVHLEPAVATLLLVTLGTGGFAYWRRMKLPPRERLGLSVEISVPRWGELSPVDKALTVGVAVALVLGAGGLAYAVGTSPPGGRFTEFYLLDANRGIDSYPSRLNASEPAQVYVGIVNHEVRDMHYNIEVRLVTVQYVYNGTTKRDDTVELRNTTLDNFPVDLTNGQRWEQSYPFQIPNAGDYQLRFLLLLRTQREPYRLVQLRIHVA